MYIHMYLLYLKCTIRASDEILLVQKQGHACLDSGFRHVPCATGTSSSSSKVRKEGLETGSCLFEHWFLPHVPVPPRPIVVFESILRCGWYISYKPMS